VNGALERLVGIGVMERWGNARCIHTATVDSISRTCGGRATDISRAVPQKGYSGRETAACTEYLALSCWLRKPGCWQLRTFNKRKF